MAKDYFQDIVPPSEDSHRERGAGAADEEATRIPINTSNAETGRSIRNIAASQRQRSRAAEYEYSQSYAEARRPGRSASRIWLWAVAAVCMLILAALLFVALRPTRVTLAPRTHTLTFSEDVFTAYPSASAGPGTLAYEVRELELEDSEVVPSEGTVYAEDKASGNLTVYNNFQTTPLKLVKNTRFTTATGLVFRAPTDIVVPAKVGNTPGKVEITVVADQPGDQYNVPAGRFTLPGLRSTPDMYAQVYAESRAAFTGGFVGERPGVAAGALESAIASVRARLETKALENAGQLDGDVVAFPALAQLEYQSLPNTAEAGGGVRIHQKVKVRVPVFDKSNFTAGVADSAIAGTDAADIALRPGGVFTAAPVGTSTVLGSGPVHFALSGSALLIWRIDEAELTAALAGKDKSAFEAIAGGFPSIQEARARIEPFWKSTFPEDPEDIKVVVEDPSEAQ